MRTRSLHLELRADDVDGDLLVDRNDASRQQYARGRSARSPRRRSARTTSSSVPLGIAARRKRRWAW